MLGIFSIEAHWEKPHELPAKPMLEAVAEHCDAKLLSHVATTPKKFLDHLLAWDKQSSEWCFVHLWFHGAQGSISVDDSDDDSQSTRLDQILDAFRQHPNNWGNCVMHFGACSTMSADSSKLQEFLDETQLSAISGYEIDVGWIEPLALESIYLHYLREELKRTSSGTTEKHMRMVRDRLTNSRYTAALCAALRFKMVVKGD